MKIFGIEFKTKRDLERELTTLKASFPLSLGQKVYRIKFRDANGLRTRTNISIDSSTVEEVIVDEKNYFKLVRCYKRQELFMDKQEAQLYLDLECFI